MTHFIDASRLRLSSLVVSSLLVLSNIPLAIAQLQFSSPTNYQVAIAPVSVAVGDFNGDGKRDLAVVNSGSANVSVLLGNGDGTFQSAINYGVGSLHPTSLAVGDFNGDHRLDLVVANGSANSVSILLGNGDGTFQNPVQYNLGVSATYVTVADFNNDTKSDLLVSTQPVGPLYQGTLNILLGRGDGTFDSPITTTITSFQGTTPFVAVGDFNADGKLDVATGNAVVYSGGTTDGNVIVLLGKGDGSFYSLLATHVNFNPVYLTTGDFNRDGKTDLAAVEKVYAENQLHQLCSSERIGALLGKGDGTFNVSATMSLPHAPCTFPAPQNPYAPNVAVRDLNNDGKLDLIAPVVVPKPSIVGGQPSAIWTFLGNGNGTFQSPQQFDLTTQPTWLGVGDFNGDPLPDVALANSSANDISIFINITP